MDKPHFKVDEYVIASSVNDKREYIIEAVVQTRYGYFYHLQASDNLALTIANVEEVKLLPAEFKSIFPIGD